jgi:hypothetical protein
LDVLLFDFDLLRSNVCAWMCVLDFVVLDLAPRTFDQGFPVKADSSALLPVCKF